MSQESSAWLNQNVLIGQAAKRGKAWHYRASDQGDEPNHYDGFIPVEDVERRLFNWEPLIVPAYKGEPVIGEDGEFATYDDGSVKYQPIMDPDRRYVIASDTFEVLGNFTDDYEPHPYKKWLLDNVGNLMDDELGISSAGLLDKRGIAWVEISLPENRQVAGLDYRPNLLACTSYNGKLATQYKRTVTATVCDNTLNAALRESGKVFTAKHTKDSGLRIIEAREALDLIQFQADAFDEAIEHLTDVEITDDEFAAMIERLFPDGKTDNSKARARSQREKITHLWTYDARVTPWVNTGLGAYQAWNTMQTHMRQAYGSTNKVERMMKDVIDGEVEKRDQPMLAEIERIRDEKAKVSVAVQMNGKLTEPETVPAPPEPGPAADAKPAPKRASRAKATK